MGQIVKGGAFERAPPDGNSRTALAEGFFDHVLRSEESATEKWDYVRNNPVRGGLAPRWQEWPYAGEIFPLEYRSERL